MGRSFFLIAFACFLTGAQAATPLKVVNGRVKEIHAEREELILSYQHPVSGRWEELTFQVDSHTGFNRGLHFQDFHENDPVSVDYEEMSTGLPRAIQVKRVDLTGVPIDRKKLPF